MRVKFFSILTLILSTILCGYAQQKYIAEEVVAVVGNRPISLSELYETTERLIQYRKENGVSSELKPAEEALEILLNQKIMVMQARIDSLDKDMKMQDEDIQEKMDQMIEKYGSMAALEKATGKAIFQLREDYKREVQEQMLSEYMEQNLRNKVKITYPEVKEFLDNFNTDSLPMMPPMFSYSQIVKMPPATDERRFEVRQRLLEFRQQILNGQKMSVLATLYSHDPGTKNTGGLYKSTYEGNVPQFSEAIKQLKPGEISEIVETMYGLHIIELISKTKTDFVARHILLKPEFTVAESMKVEAELDSIAKLIRAGKITFAEAALRDSDDKTTKLNGGATFNSTAYRYTRDMSRTSRMFIPDEIRNPVDLRVLNKLKKGEVSAPFETIDDKANRVYKIVTITDMVPTHKVDIIYDYGMIKSEALKVKQEKYLADWLKKAIGKIYVNINDDYRHYNIRTKEWFEQSDRCKKSLAENVIKDE